MMNIAKQYYKGLKQAYINNHMSKKWNDFERHIQGASKQDIEALKTAFPDVPSSLIELLQLVDGTYFRIYNDKKITMYFLGSDLVEYPYYLLSISQMLDQKRNTMINSWLIDYVNRIYGNDIEIDDKITTDGDHLCWLHFSDCMNNGGSSQLFLDFTPSKKGVKGQVIRYLHDPDGLEVIADSFDDYLKMLMHDGYDFITMDID